MFTKCTRELPWTLNSGGSSFQLEMRLRLFSLGLTSNFCYSKYVYSIKTISRHTLLIPSHPSHKLLKARLVTKQTQILCIVFSLFICLPLPSDRSKSFYGQKIIVNLRTLFTICKNANIFFYEEFSNLPY